ncbi:MAG: FAD-dependent oxidoreductase [Comamonadaceae bacterium]|nr:MAG: FAD-dependent oxidoreductase [Comamonadaceae bacterium]
MHASSAATALPDRVPVLIAGGGPVGLTLAGLLGRLGTPSLVIENDEGYCTGSRAICISRRSQEILGWSGAVDEVVRTGLPWTGGRSYFREHEVLHFTMPTDPAQRFAPMVNIQQFHVERFAAEAAVSGGPADLRWSHAVVAVRARPDGVEVDIRCPDGTLHTVHADWLVACDGGRSTVREQLGLQLEGTQYEGRYVIVDIEQETRRPTERLAWFDPPSNPGSTLLMHRQPGNVWRIDYQVADHEDPREAIRPENVLPRVQSHLDMIGETAPWRPLWISIYNAKCLTLPSYRHGRVLFAGDAGHLVPIFGVRGLNSGLDDAGNLAWKLALVQQGRAGASLLDTYSRERVQATRENLAYGAKSTEFMAPPHAGFGLMREAALRLATEDPGVSTLINPRQSLPVAYVDSPLSLADAPGQAGEADAPVRGGMPAPEALLQAPEGARHLSELFGRSFVALHFDGGEPATAQGDGALPEPSAGAPARPMRPAPTADSVEHWHIARGGAPGAGRWLDPDGTAWARFGARSGDIWLVRPDGYLVGRWHGAGAAAAIATALTRLLDIDGVAAAASNPHSDPVHA